MKKNYINPQYSQPTNHSTSNPTFLFYDLETSGLNKCFDQVLQFGSIRTDLQLNELSRQELYVRLNCDTVPSPQAMITHRISLGQLKNAPNEFEVMQIIHQLLNVPNTCSLGYNTLNFDDEFLRFSFYKNFLPPYTHQYANACSRADLYPIVILFYLFKPESLQWPIKNNKPSFKLEDLNQINCLNSGSAHNAMVDVEVCIALAKRLMQYSELWSYALSFFNKNIDLKRQQELPTAFKIADKHFYLALLIDGKLGSEQFQVPVLSLGQHQHYKNQSLWLRLDKDYLQKTTEAYLSETTEIFRKRAGESPILLPLKENFLAQLNPERKKIMKDNLNWLQQHPNLLLQICDYYQHTQYPEILYLDADAALYKIGFPTTEEEKIYAQFHQATHHEKIKILETITNPVRKNQALRILGRHYSEILSDQQKQEFVNYLQQIINHTDIHMLSDYKGGFRLAPQQAIEIIQKMQIDETYQLFDDEQKQLLLELESYLRNLLEGLD